MEKTLVVLAAGMGSRFGGLKQIEPVGPSGEFIIDYSVYDAIKAGYTKVVFLIKAENREIFEETIGKRISKKIKVEYAYQDVKNIPVDVELERTKPFGTGHALYCVKGYADAPFSLISADDFYGYGAFEAMSKFLDEEPNKLAIVGYNLPSTITTDEGAKRGVIFEKDGEVEGIVECKVKKAEDCVVCEELQGTKVYRMPFDACCGMLMYAVNLDIYPEIDRQLADFVKSADLEKDEFFLTDVIDYYVKENKVKLIKTDEKWMGLTYKEDMDLLKERIKEDIAKGIYKDNLWEE